MLIAKLNNERIDAAVAQRGVDYFCPECGGHLILKKGRIVIDHFAHKPPFNCSWATGETREHLEAKRVIAQSLEKRGLKTQIEYVVSGLPGDRRADVMVWHPKTESQVAIELQHSAIDLDELEARSLCYARQNITQIWIPFIRPSVWKDGEWTANKEWFVRRYSPRPFEKWVHGFHGKSGMWMYDPDDKKLWHGRLKSHDLYIESKSYFTEGGVENYSDAYTKRSKRFRELTLKGPYFLEVMRIQISNRKAFSASIYNWPAASVANLVSPD